MFTAILLPVDLADESSWRKALPAALRFASDNGAQLHVLNVVPDFGMSIVGGFFPDDFEKKALESAKQALAKFMTDHVPKDAGAKGHVAHGVIYEEVLHAADTLKCDLIVIGAGRPELKDYLLGPNAARIVRHADQSVMVVRE